MDDVRDVGLIAVLIAFSVLALAAAVVVGVAGVLSLRVVLAARRAHDARLLPRLQALRARQEAWTAGGGLEPSQMVAAGLGVLRRIRARRRRKRPWYRRLIR